jgi:predicted PurR-regulated permease PerM
MKETTTISISSGSIIRIVAILTLCALLFYVRDFVIALLVAVVLASAAEMPVKKLAKWGIPRTTSVIAIFLSLVLLVVATIFIFIPPLADAEAGKMVYTYAHDTEDNMKIYDV